MSFETGMVQVHGNPVRRHVAAVVLCVTKSYSIAATTRIGRCCTKHLCTVHGSLRAREAIAWKPLRINEALVPGFA